MNWQAANVIAAVLSLIIMAGIGILHLDIKQMQADIQELSTRTSRIEIAFGRVGQSFNDLGHYVEIHSHQGVMLVEEEETDPLAEERPASVK